MKPGLDNPPAAPRAGRGSNFQVVRPQSITNNPPGGAQKLCAPPQRRIRLIYRAKPDVRSSQHNDTLKRSGRCLLPEVPPLKHAGSSEHAHPRRNRVGPPETALHPGRFFALLVRARKNR